MHARMKKLWELWDSGMPVTLHELWYCDYQNCMIWMGMWELWTVCGLWTVELWDYDMDGNYQGCWLAACQWRNFCLDCQLVCFVCCMWTISEHLKYVVCQLDDLYIEYILENVNGLWAILYCMTSWWIVCCVHIRKLNELSNIELWNVLPTWCPLICRIVSVH